MGVEILVVDPHEPYRVAHMLRNFAEADGKAVFPILADSAGTVSAAYGVFSQMRIHTEWSNRPATFIVDREGVLRFRHLATKYSDRPTIDKVMSVVRQLAGVPEAARRTVAENSATKTGGDSKPEEAEPATMSRSEFRKVLKESASGFTLAAVFHPACGGCLTESIALVESRDTWKQLGVPVIGLALSSDGRAVKRFAQAAKASYRFERTPWAADAFRVRLLPTLVIFDTSGNEVFRSKEGEEHAVRAALDFLQDAKKTR